MKINKNQLIGVSPNSKLLKQYKSSCLTELSRVQPPRERGPSRYTSKCPQEPNSGDTLRALVTKQKMKISN